MPRIPRVKFGRASGKDVLILPADDGFRRPFSSTVVPRMRTNTFLGQQRFAAQKGFGVIDTTLSGYT